MKNNNALTRKDFFKKIANVSLLPIGAAWYSSVARDKAGNSLSKKVRIQPFIEKGITFKDDIIINRNNHGVKVFSAKCTHLGCKINKAENNELVCPCHGSRFSLDGKVISGPAGSNLTELKTSVDKSTKEIIINVPD